MSYWCPFTEKIEKWIPNGAKILEFYTEGKWIKFKYEFDGRIFNSKISKGRHR